MKLQFPPAPHSLPGSMSELVRQLADKWAKDLSRPCPSPDVLAHWDSLVNAWYSDKALPLFVRKVANNRGTVLRHHASGRELVPADNSPAHWSLGLAVMGEMPSLDSIRETVRFECHSGGDGAEKVGTSDGQIHVLA